MPTLTPPPLPFRDALRDDKAVASIVRYVGSVPVEPLVTIAIPTFNRPTLIRETLASALAQDFAGSVEILIIDNASQPENVETLLDHLRSLGDVPVHYVVNDTNLGMFGNWNRCIALARGQWLTILNDDDLLAPDHLTRMMQELASKPNASTSLTCGFTYLDQRTVKPRSPRVTAALLRLKKLLRFCGSKSIELTPRRLFWSNIAGSSLGAVFPRALAVEIGGFYPEDFPSADYFFHARCAMRGRLRQIDADLAFVRLQENESMKPTTLLGFIAANHRLRMGLIGSGAVPLGWRRYAATLIAYERHASLRIWGGRLNANEVAGATGIRERPMPSALVWIAKALRGGV